MAKNTSILLGEHFDEFISTQVKSGRFASASEVVRTALRLYEQEEKKIEELRQALKEGVESGFVPFDGEKILADIHAKYLKASVNQKLG